MRDLPDGATPLDPDESAGLLLTHLSTRGELDRWELDNIAEAMAWLSRKRPTKILTESFLRDLHRRMFSNVWAWAGRFRTTLKNIGCPPFQIAVELRNLLLDTATWIEHASFSPDELAARFHHRLVQIHPFPNGNGRHARLMADLLLENVLQRPPFTWGKRRPREAGETRRAYIRALRAADDHDLEPLVAFVRS